MSSIKKQFVSGVFYTAVAKYIGLIIQLVITGILSRLLTPGDFGVVAIATVFIVFFNLLSDVGIGVAIIQNKTLNKDDIQSIFSFSIYIGIALAILFFSLSSLIASIYQKPILLSVCRLLSINILFSSFNIVPNGLLLKNKQFKFIALRTLLIQTISGLLGVIFAIYGFGIYALLIYSISSSVFLFIFNYLKSSLNFQLKCTLAALKKIFHYSVYQFCFNFINYFSRNLDTLFIGKFLSVGSLGYYDKAYRLMLLPIENLTHVLSPVIHPLFSDFQIDKKRIFDGYLKIVRILAFLGFPLSIYLHFASGELIFIIFGSQWQSAVPVFKILAWSVGIQIVLSSSGAIFQAANNTRLLFISGLLSAVCMILGICYGVFFVKTIEGTAYGLTFAFLINFIQCFFILIRALRGSFIAFINIFRVPIFLSLLIFLSETAFEHYFNIDGISINFILKTLISIIAVILGIFLTGEYRIIRELSKSIIKG